MITNFNNKLFCDTKDANVAIFIENLAGWIKLNSGKDKPEDRNHFEGQYWSYNSYSEFSRYFEGWSVKVIRAIVAKCVKLGLILISNFNKKRYDNTNWYTLTDKALSYYPQLSERFSHTPAQTGSTPAQTGRPIPSLPTQDLNNTTSTSEPLTPEVPREKPSKPKQVTPRELIEIYREEFPNNPQPHPRLISTSLQKVLNTLIKRWPEIDPEGKSLTLYAFRTYLSFLKSNAPKFSLGEYFTEAGNRKKNGLETFARWNTIVKFLENQYS
jgi:hypothetical protein